MYYLAITSKLNLKTMHISVLLNEAVTGLVTSPAGYYLDATFGRGGHSRAILEKLDANGQLYATDQDPSAAAVAKQIQDPRFHFARGRFSHFLQLFPHLSAQSLDGVLLDLGVSSPQLDEAERGFSFSRNGVLDMRMNPESGQSAKAFIAKVNERTLSDIIYRYGEERFAKAIAKAIIKARNQAPIETTQALADIVKNAVPAHAKNQARHPATRTFQAIRIHVNEEIKELEDVLAAAFIALKPNGRLVVIAFHSLEDDVVKRFIKQHSGSNIPPEIPVFDSQQFKQLRQIGKPIRASASEIHNNPRARSAILRVIEKCA